LKVKKKMNYPDALRTDIDGSSSLRNNKTRSSRIVLVFRCLIYGARTHMELPRLTCSLAIACAMAGMLLSAGCARRSAARLPAPARIGSSETGIASWYGVPYHGRPSASGEIFDMEKLTAAHRALPFQTWVEVTNLSNGKQVNVRITDRGPFVHRRIIDVSMAAARQLDMVRTGTARVKLKVIAAPVNEPPVNALDNSQIPMGEYAVQAGAFSDPVRAEIFRQSLPYPDARVLPRQEGSSLWRVVVGHALSLQRATTLAAEVTRTAGQAMVIKEDATP
jgi:rare lipoprotein A